VVAAVAPTAAQTGAVSIIEPPMDWISAIVGAANMDDDPAEEIAIICVDDVPPTSAPGRARDPGALRLDQNRPNPFNAQTDIAFELGRRSHVTLRVFDPRGRLVATVLDGSLDAGRHTATWTGTDDRGRSLASGTYVYQLEADGEVQTRKSVLLR